MRKTLAMILCLALALSFGLCACAPKTTETPTTTEQPAAPEQPATNEEPAAPEAEMPSFKIALGIYTLSGAWSENIQAAVKSLADAFNCEIVFFEGGATAETAIAAVDNVIAQGVDGIINLSTGASVGVIVEKCQAAGVYYAICNDDYTHHPDFPAVVASSYFVGQISINDYKAAYEMAKDMLAKGAKKFAIASLPPGITASFDARVNGAMDAINEVSDASIIAEQRSFNKTEACQNIVAQYPDVEAIICGYSVAENLAQPLLTAGMTGKVLTSGYDSGEGTLEAFQDGTYSYLAEGCAGEAQLVFVMLYNALTGHPMLDEAGNKPNIAVDYLLCKSLEDYENLAKYTMDGNYAFTPDEAKAMCVAFNPNATYADFANAAASYSLADVIARRAG